MVKTDSTSFLHTLRWSKPTVQVSTSFQHSLRWSKRTSNLYNRLTRFPEIKTDSPGFNQHSKMDFSIIYTYATRIAVIKTCSMSFYKPPTRVAVFKRDSSTLQHAFWKSERVLHISTRLIHALWCSKPTLEVSTRPIYALRWTRRTLQHSNTLWGGVYMLPKQTSKFYKPLTF